MSVIDILINYHTGFLEGLLVTLELYAVIVVSGILLGGLLGVFAAEDPILRYISQGMAFFLGAVPTLVFLFWLHYPAQAVFEIVIDPFYTAALTLSIVNIFAISELVRQAIQGFPQQFLIAGRVTGLRTKDIVLKIQLPMLFRQLLPALLITQVTMLHSTLFASLISVEEIFRVAQRINAQIYKPVEIYTALGVFFLIVCLPINLLAYHLKQRFTRDFSER
ncbi:MAG TPA: ABC transporter permease subunit [Alphaproteobacteria bacterium]